MILIADSGSTKTDWCMADENDGRIVCRINTEGINPVHLQEEKIAAIIDEMKSRISGGSGDVSHVGKIFFYGAGCAGRYADVMKTILSMQFPDAKEIDVESDLVAAARALCGKEEGIACILGTGSNSCYYDGEKIAGNVPALGYILGDEGSGAVLGRLFVNALYKGELAESTKRAFDEQTGLSMADIIQRVYREAAPNRFLASFGRFVAEHKDEDESLRQIVVSNFRDFFRKNISHYHRQDLSVNAIGSIAAHFSDELSEAAGGEGFTIGKVLKSPMEGLLSYHL